MMEHLNFKDRRLVFEFIHDLYQWHDYQSFRQQVVRGIASLVPADLYTYNEISKSQQLVTGYAIWPTEFPLSPDAPEIVGRYQHQLPCLTHYLSTGDGRPTKISDFMTYREFRKSDLHNCFYRPTGIPYAIAFGVTLNNDGMTGIGLHRNGKDYTERDRAVLSLLHSHIVQAYKNARTITSLQSESAHYESALSKEDCSILCLSLSHKIVWASPGSWQTLQHYKLISPRSQGRLHQKLINWVKVQGAGMSYAKEVPDTRLPLTVRSERGRLEVRYIKRGETQLLLMEETRKFQAESVPGNFGLSDRETTVLWWLTEGKTNSEIGSILCISPRTVQKHLERIYSKLGVENRHAVTRLIRDLRQTALIR